MKKLTYNRMANEALAQLQKGAFLTTSAKGEVNTMTIAWGNIGFMWGRKVFTVMVRPSRHTFKLIDGSDNFTVSLPIYEDLHKQLNYCGMKSGKDEDKIKNLGLTLKRAQVVKTPIIGECSLHYECKIIATQKLTPDSLIPEIEEKSYNKGNYHTLFYGEIVDCYLTTEN